MTPSSMHKLMHFFHSQLNGKAVVAIISLGVTLVLLGWSLANYQPIHNFYGPRAIYSLIILAVLLALLGRLLLLRLLSAETSDSKLTPQRLRNAWKPLFFVDITAPLYLAAGVLISVPAAVITAIVTQIFLQGFTLLRGFISWKEAMYRVGSTAMVVLLADGAYTWISGTSHSNYGISLPIYHVAESKELLGSILSAIIMQLLIVLVSFPLMAQGPDADLRTAFKTYIHSPVPLFQLLILSVGPLIPVVDIFDDAAAELAWVFFLIPLFAIYYLALTSTRLSISTSELQRTLQDLSSARRRQDELRDYASLITRVQEEERRRLARELHDDTAQALIALSLGLEGLERGMGKLNLPEKDVLWLSNLQTLAASTLEGVRRACRDLRPSVLDDLGLRAALEWLSDSSAARGVPCTFTCTGRPQSTKPEAEIAIFRIVQEALANIWRHSQATQACLELHYQPDHIQICVCDNGRGFVTDQHDLKPTLNSTKGLGLLGMRERAMLIDASLSITSQPGKGCSVVLLLPLATNHA
ncbi:MAG: sensor histidine kinase [Ktedonobacteraceae bacterium]|jgi:signal transduction histidine kinase